MAVWAVESQDLVWGFPWTQQSGGSTDVTVRRAPARGPSRIKSFSTKDAARCRCFKFGGGSSRPGGPVVKQLPQASLVACGYGGDERGETAEAVNELCHQGRLTEAVEALGVLVQKDCCISRSLFYDVLKKCVVEKDLVLGRRVHAFIVKMGYQLDTFLCNHVLRMYVSHGRLQDAMDVFTLVVKPDAFMWSSIISAHVKHGQDKQALQLYRQMRGSDVKADGHVFVAALQACARGLDLESGQQVHADVLASGLEPNLFVLNCLVDMYAKCGSLEDAQKLFDGLVQKDVVTWTALIAGYSQQGRGQDALRLYSDMQEGSIAVPNAVTFVCLLQACASVGTQALETGKQIHGQIREQGCHADVFVASSLVNMYAKCGSLEDAQKVFDRRSHKDVVMWNAMIAGCSQQGMGWEALRIYSTMQEDGIAVPTSVTFVCLLQACASIGNLALEEGKQLHVQIRERGLQADVLVANSLINMYAKCGSLEDAQRVFDRLVQKNVVTWTCLIAEYCHQGMCQEALCLYSAMQGEGIAVPNSATYVCLLQACASVGTLALDMGKQLHTQIREGGYEADKFVASCLVDMYAKCGSLEDNRYKRSLPAPDFWQRESPEVLWLNNFYKPGWADLQLAAVDGERGCRTPNIHWSLLDDPDPGQPAGYRRVVTAETVSRLCHQGYLPEAIEALGVLVQANACISKSLLYTVMNKCVLNKDFVLGRQVHAFIIKQGFQSDTFLCNHILRMYASHGRLRDAMDVFNMVEQPDAFMWSSIISAHVKQGKDREAIQLYHEMRRSSVKADGHVFVAALQACAKASDLETGQHVHADVLATGVEPDLFVWNALVHMYAKCGSLEEAQRVFDRLVKKDVVTWTAMIAGYSQQGLGQEALRLYKAMQENSMAVPDSVTFVCLLQACANVAALHVGRELHAHIKQEGLEGDLCVANSLIHMYGKSGSMVDAQEVFDALPTRDVFTWSALIAGYACQGDSELVFDLLLRMRSDGILPVGITFLSILTVCSHAGLVNKGREYFEAMSKHSGITATVEHYTCMVDILGRAGQVDEALALVRTMPVVPDAAVWTTLLGACQKWGNVEVGRHAFDQAVRLDKTDAAPYVLMLNIYTGAQMWEQAQEMQGRRKVIRAWKQPGQSWWTDMDGLVHGFLALVQKNEPS